MPSERRDDMGGSKQIDLDVLAELGLQMNTVTGMPDAVGPQSSFSTDDRFGPGSSRADTNSLAELSFVDDEGKRSA